MPSLIMPKCFDGNTFRPHGVIPSLLVELGGKTILVEVEFIDARLDYDLLLDCRWTYAMAVVVYRVIKFPHKGKIVTSYKLLLCRKNPTQPEPNVPMVEN